MSKKFHKYRSVTFDYFAVLIFYPYIMHRNNKNKELVLLDDYGQHFVAAYRNNATCRIGMHFLLKKINTKKQYGFIFKDKFYSLRTRSGWVW